MKIESSATIEQTLVSKGDVTLGSLGGDSALGGGDDTTTTIKGTFI